jgi:hypothetical protein
MAAGRSTQLSRRRDQGTAHANLGLRLSTNFILDSPVIEKLDASMARSSACGRTVACPIFGQQTQQLAFSQIQNRAPIACL